MKKDVNSIESRRFRLAEIEQSDVKNIHKGLSNPEVTKYYDVSFTTIEATQEQMDCYDDLKKSGTGIWWGIYCKDTGQFCEAGGFSSLIYNHKKPSLFRGG